MNSKSQQNASHQNFIGLPTDTMALESEYRSTKKIHCEDNQIPIFSNINSIQQIERCNSQDKYQKLFDYENLLFTNEEIPGNQQDPSKKWQWEECSGEIINFINQNSPINTSRVPTQDEMRLIQRISISLKKEFMHDNSLGWNWHKGWNIPTIEVALTGNCFGLDDTLSTIEVELKAFESKQNNYSKSFPSFVELKGESIQSFHTGIASFFGLKFGTTSHSHRGAKIYLMIQIRQKKDVSGESTVLTAFNSPPIFVDSRKATRDTQTKKKEKKLSKYSHPFPPWMLDKTFIKKDKDAKNVTQSKIIGNGLQSFCDYLTASNIKNKIKHLVFFLIKFSEAIKLYCHSRSFGTESKDSALEEIILQLQNTLSIDESKVVPTTCKIDMESIQFIILFGDTTEVDSFVLNKLVGEHFEPLKHKAIKIVLNKSMIPPDFIQLSAVEIEKAYFSVYPRLMIDALSLKT